MVAQAYITQIPSDFITEDGVTHKLKASDIQNISREPLFENWIPPEKLSEVKDYLLSTGFKIPGMALPQGEVFGLTRSLDPILELHIRAFPDGRIQSHVEVKREFFEHLGGQSRIYVVYEAYQFYRPVVNEFYLRYISSNSYVTSIIQNFNVSIPAPSKVTPWKPIVMGIGMAAIIGLALYYLSKPPKRESR
ncbi:hypothetical protein Thermo_01681 [Thermoplasmatales archaeon]|nr:hypothetical protein Thermo_01681 [Thermoplasmatales archaeon]